MARLCERPGCSAPAGVIYGVDIGARLVWFEPLSGDVGYGRGVLCLRHADAMVVPRGWSLDDRREPVPRLFRAPAEEQPPPKRRRARRVAEPVVADPLPIEPPTALVDPTAPVDPTALVDPTAPGGEPRPWQPLFDETDDLAGVLRANSPMLARAFRPAARPEREG